VKSIQDVSPTPGDDVDTDIDDADTEEPRDCVTVKEAQGAVVLGQTFF